MWRLTAAVGRVLDIGSATVPEEDFARSRRVRIVNAASVLAVPITRVYCAFYAICDGQNFDGQNFRHGIMFLPEMAGLYAATLIMTRSGRVELATWTLAKVALFHLGTVSWMLGRNAGAATGCCGRSFLSRSSSG